jgi:hypothetical protein
LRLGNPAAYKLNIDKEFDPQPPVFAVLTDLKDFYFFSYDGSTFKMDKEIRVSPATRVDFLKGMGEGSVLLLSLRNLNAKLVNSHGAFVFYYTPRLYLCPRCRGPEVYETWDYR